ncbi:hypothetical protein TD95_002288 [Thielaviopsis punctulata]|uniref:Uncharacterized protein n=1 Tax=Thielaviopsis punctulata TaxID=72032 RepID=A0A0F4ZKN6_9PEZI|nr:hypothetical protein TD95_002288 [Thielaviopsis punctulata]
MHIHMDHRRSSSGDVGPSRRPSTSGRSEGGQEPSRRRQYHVESFNPSQSRTSRAKGRDRDSALRGSSGRLFQWPPAGMAPDDVLDERRATALIGYGASTHRGYKKPIPHADPAYFRCFSSSSCKNNGLSGRANNKEIMADMQSMVLQGVNPENRWSPWQTVEQPSYTFYYGCLPGTITLNQWAWSASVIPEAIQLRKSSIELRDVDLIAILQRIYDLQDKVVFDVDDEEVIYKRFIRDPDSKMRSHGPNNTRPLERQVVDLIHILSRPDWIDFSQRKNQLVTQFIFNTTLHKEDDFYKFYHQILLTLELLFRLTHRRFPAEERKRMTTEIPPSVQWSLALARRWKENVRIEEFDREPKDVKLAFPNKKLQMKCIRRFARELKWPHLRETLDEMKYLDGENQLHEMSEDSMAFFSGLILPGDSFPYITMNTLTDMDPDPASGRLEHLLMDYPDCGFQYRNSCTYWSVTSIVGKVLAPTCHTIGGWVGPARPTNDLARTEIARLIVNRPKQRIRGHDVEEMRQVSSPLGPEAEEYAVDEYVLPLPNQHDMVDTVRIELLTMERDDGAGGNGADKRNGSAAASGGAAKHKDRDGEPAGPGDGSSTSSAQAQPPQWYNAKVIFAIDGTSWPLCLQFDVSFISAWPCSDGPHPLWIDYLFERVSVDKIVRIQNWGGVYRGSQQYQATSVVNDDGDETKVLVIEAFGVRDNEVLARAWSAHWGLSAVVADVATTCIGCAIREAYAAALTVVILIDSQLYEEEEIN